MILDSFLYLSGKNIGPDDAVRNLLADTETERTS